MRWMRRWYVDRRLEVGCSAVDKLTNEHLRIGPITSNFLGTLTYGPENPKETLRENHPFRTEREADRSKRDLVHFLSWYAGPQRSKQFF